MSEIVYSQYQFKKAQKILDLRGVANIGDGLYQVQSGTDSEESYMVEGGECSCPGSTKFKKNCTHKLVVEMFKEKGEKYD